MKKTFITLLLFPIVLIFALFIGFGHFINKIFKLFNINFNDIFPEYFEN